MRTRPPDSRPETRKSHTESPNNSVEKWGVFFELYFRGPVSPQGGHGGKSRRAHRQSRKANCPPRKFHPNRQFFSPKLGKMSREMARVRLVSLISCCSFGDTSPDFSPPGRPTRSAEAAYTTPPRALPRQHARSGWEGVSPANGGNLCVRFRTTYGLSYHDVF